MKKIIIKTVLIALSSLTFYFPITYANTVSWYITQGMLARNKWDYKAAIDFYDKAQ